MTLIHYIMIGTGIVLLILEFLKILKIPDIVRHIHLIRTGIGFYAVRFICIIWGDEILNDDEFMDDSGDN